MLVTLRSISILTVILRGAKNNVINIQIYIFNPQSS